ncbi:hypothetical protein XENTR_v10004932 [Xenopus tropicalis]|nr:hypothetical protein XENTR_v10004932 [Xenopus tropicalis]
MYEIYIYNIVIPFSRSEAFNSFLKLCLTKKQRDRPKAKALIQHPFVKDLQNEAEAKEELRVLIRRANTIRACEKGKGFVHFLY